MSETNPASAREGGQRAEAQRQAALESRDTSGERPAPGSVVPVDAPGMQPVPAAGALAPEGHPDFRAGTAALAAMPDDEFEVRLIAMRRGRERITRIHRELMDPETDYGVIPGTKQPTLLKPGAEKLCDFYRLAAQFRPEISYGDGHNAPPISVVTECRLHLGALGGPVVNTGYGAANSWEKRYRYRRGERSCPACGKLGTIVKGRAEYGGGWICFAKKGGCGAKYPDEAPEIVDQPVGDIENPDPYDLLNTLLKIAEKRAYVNATLRATATSGLYTQDVEEHAVEAESAAAARSRPAEPAADPSPSAVSRAPTAPDPGNTIDLSARLTPPPATLKEAYIAFLEAVEAAGLDRRDAETARRLMQSGAGRRSSKAAPYTIEEFLRVAAQLRRKAAGGGAATPREAPRTEETTAPSRRSPPPASEARAA